MNQSCPVSLKNVDSNIVRLVALQTVIVGIVFIITKMPIFALILFYDFAARGVRLPKFSPFIIVAKWIVKMFKMQAKSTDEAPKRFALFIGLFMLILINALILIDEVDIQKTLMIILVICASLEAFFDYCVGCKVYWFVKKFF